MHEPAAPPVDPYSDAYNAPPPAAPAAVDSASRDPPPPRGRSRSRSPGRSAGYRSPPPYRSRRASPPPRRPPHAPIVGLPPVDVPPRSHVAQAPNPSNVLGVFGLSIRTTERDLDDEFSKFGRVEKVTIVYDQRSDRSRGFGFIKMSTVEEATRCVTELNGIDLNGRRIRVDYSVTDRPHAPTPGEYMGHRSSNRDSYLGGRDRRDRDPRDSYRDRDRDYHRRGDYDRPRDRDRDRDPYGRDSRDWRDRRSPPPSRGGRYSPEYRRRRSYSRSPPRGSSPSRPPRDYDAPPAANGGDSSRW
ncbi:RNA-binding domain-containing protein [Dentipellis sp. KUC8613]|nr:RNA-binding domain-containing protein [Dentipellis sp. KUC8613]